MSYEADKFPDDDGIHCPRCGCNHLPVVYVRSRDHSRFRVRRCRQCGHRVGTRETITTYDASARTALPPPSETPSQPDLQ